MSHDKYDIREDFHSRGEIKVFIFCTILRVQLTYPYLDRVVLHPGNTVTQTLDAKILLKLPHGSINSNKEPLGDETENHRLPRTLLFALGGGGEAKGKVLGMRLVFKLTS